MAIAPLLQCFVTDFTRVQFNMMEPGQRSDLLLSFLPEFTYQFLQPLFLATGLSSQNITTAAKKAMIRIAAIMHQGIDVITQDVLAASLMDYLNPFLHKVSVQFSMPQQPFMHGGICPRWTIQSIRPL
jgi:hypothetical protein